MECDKNDSDQIVSDAIFGLITLKSYILPIIDTPQFQRLRFIWQLGVTSFVYPTADHCRFEHSIGTYWLASRLVRKIKQQFDSMTVEERPGMEITEMDVKCVEIAALCHDIGHGPFSHVWDLKVMASYDIPNKKSHEELFMNIWNLMLKNEGVKEMVIKQGFLTENYKFINDIINGTPEPGKELLCSIVSNSESGLDVDKWDYLARDATYLGHASTNYRADIERMIHLSRAVKCSDGIWRIGFRNTEGLNIIRVFQLRHYMHQTAYRHRKVIAIELMMVDGIKEWITKENFIMDDIVKAKWILKQTDSLFYSNIKRIAVFKKILDRKLYTLLFEAEIYKLVPDPKSDIINYLKKKRYERDDIRLDFSTFQLSKCGKDPILKIPFYTKETKELVQYNKKNLPSYLRIDCNQSRVLVFLTNEKTRKKKYVDNIKKVLEEYFRCNHWIFNP